MYVYEKWEFWSAFFTSSQDILVLDIYVCYSNLGLKTMYSVVPFPHCHILFSMWMFRVLLHGCASHLILKKSLLHRRMVLWEYGISMVCINIWRLLVMLSYYWSEYRKNNGIWFMIRCLLFLEVVDGKRSWKKLLSSKYTANEHDLVFLFIFFLYLNTTAHTANLAFC